MMLEPQQEGTAGVEAEENIEDQQHEHKLLNCDPEVAVPPGDIAHPYWE